ncbi:sugar phosphate isomerase/epimerase [Paenibacillus sp. IB182496]|uniref:Sugar phosphate isomerase/epimerase n=1 Tax=Paenibacillus sabuli TaxID=2772509 RepID=A0A927BTS8_9BACL|nr:sugar phosphate isomerase/epimerase [Paenibacillus sabuli]MBD2845630.1 sugar phosphate isomerase/epimerase [Paenibacillus sabuli]
MKLSTIGAQLYTVREFTKTPEDLKETFRKIKDIGYTTVQLSAIGPMDPEQVKALADEAGLSICATHIPFNRLQDELDQVIAEHKLWDCKYVGLGSIPPDYRNAGAAGYAKFAADTAGFTKKLHENGLQFVYHNHKFEFEKFDNGRLGMDILIEDTDPAHFGLELDLYWVHAGGADPSEWVRKASGRLPVVHLKDMAIVNNEQVFAEIGEGNLNYRTIVDACRASGVEWYVVEQDVCRRDPFESLAISFRNLKELV